MFTESQSSQEADRLTALIQPSHNYLCDASPPCGAWHVGRDKPPPARGPSTFATGDDTPRTLGRVARIVPASHQVQEDQSL